MIGFTGNVSGNNMGASEVANIPYNSTSGGRYWGVNSLFEDAAEVIVNAQQGSASLLQRKLKLGYNRAGRIVDQLEATGLIGPHRGSKARDVLIPDVLALEQFLSNLREKGKL